MSCRAVAGLHVAIFTLLLLVAGGCSKQDRASRETADTTRTTTTSDRYEPLGQRVDPADPSVAAMRPKLGEWTRIWGQVFPRFTLDSLYRSAPEPLRYAYSRKVGLEMNDLARARYFGALSPDSMWIAEPSIYWSLEDGVPDLQTEPDAASALLDLRSDSLHILATYGTLGAFDETFWLDRDRFVVVGRAERAQEPAIHGADVWVYDLGQRTLTRYHTPDMDTEKYRRYLRLLDPYLTKRYRLPAPA